MPYPKATLTRTSVGIQSGGVQTARQSYNPDATASVRNAASVSGPVAVLMNAGVRRDIAEQAVAGTGAVPPFPNVPAEPVDGAEASWTTTLARLNNVSREVALWLCRYGKQNQPGAGHDKPPFKYSRTEQPVAYGCQRDAAVYHATDHNTDFDTALKAVRKLDYRLVAKATAAKGDHPSWSWDECVKYAR
jgi:hypothetical protein